MVDWAKKRTSDFRAQLPIDNDAELFNHGRRGPAEFGIQMRPPSSSSSIVVVVSRPNTSRGWILISYPFLPFPPCFSFLIPTHSRSVSIPRLHGDGEAAWFFRTFELRSSLFYTCVISHARMRLVWDPFMLSQCSSTRPSVVNQYVGIGWCTCRLI